jgi:hypothetical protein
MLAVSRSQPGNRLLAMLLPADFKLLNLQSVPLRLRQELERPNRAIDDVYFPHIGFVSVVAVQSKTVQVEVGLIGCEGMTGTSVVLGNDRSPHSTYVQAKARLNVLLFPTCARRCKRASRCAACYCDMFRSLWCRPRIPPSPMREPGSIPGWRVGC